MVLLLLWVKLLIGKQLPIFCWFRNRQTQFPRFWRNLCDFEAISNWCVLKGFLPGDFHQTPQKEACGSVGRPADMTEVQTQSLCVSTAEKWSIIKKYNKNG